MRVFDVKTGALVEKSESVKHYEITKDGDVKFVIPKGEKGDIGPVGLRGEKGDKGDRGDIGPIGKVGPNGVKGDKGEKGDQGDKGDIGPAGPKGDTGKNGLNGKDGIDGVPNLIHSSKLKPEDSLGNNNDWCFTDLNEIYYRKDNKWKFYTQISSGYSRKAIIGMIQEFGGGGGGAVEDQIVDGVIDKAPSQNAVFDALALKYDASNPNSYETTTQLNTRDTNNRARSNHTGSQLAATISDFAATVRATVLTGYSVGSNAVLAATDTILAAFGKLQAQINNKVSAFTVTTNNGISGTIGGTTTNPTIILDFNSWDNDTQTLESNSSSAALTLAGYSETGQPAGDLRLQAGDSDVGFGGNIYMIAGIGIDGGGGFNAEAGAGGTAGQPGDGGNCSFFAGIAYGSGNGGTLEFYGGNSDSGSHGAINFLNGAFDNVLSIADNGAGSPTIGFFGVTKVTKPAAATGLDVALAALGLRTSGSPNALNLDKTLTATVGNVTINKVSGQVNLGAAASSLTLTNSLISTSSIIILTLASNPGVAVGSLYAVAASGSCTINVTTAVVNQTKINFMVIN